MTDLADKIIVALDVATKEEALGLTRCLGKRIQRFKIGLQLYTAAGPEMVKEIAETGAKVFLDLKLHDIPNTVASTVKVAVTLRVDMLTIHLTGGEEMIRAAVDAAEGRTRILGVTVLTSQTEQTLNTVGVTESLDAHVARLASLGVKCGVTGLVASPREAAALRRQMPDIRIVTPGIRPSWSATGDQKRITTPRQALDAGADYLVIGRPIIADPQPLEAVEKILTELQA